MATWSSGLRMRGFLTVATALLALLLSGCMAQTQQLGPRPAHEPLDAAEAYLQRFQPGPLPRVFQSTRIYDRNGVLLAERWNEGRRTWLPLHRISEHLIDATIATEDATFFSNTGIDPARIVGAAMKNYQEGQVVSGASTITMQLARNLFLGPEDRYEQSMDRKMLEAGLAQELNTLFSKDELLEMYLNLANYAHLAYGPEAAARVYFAKSAADLSLAEATLIAGIPQQPANLDLFRNYAGAKARQRQVLDLMIRHGYLAESQADAVYAEPIYLNPDPDARLVQSPQFVQYVEDTLNARLGQGYAPRSGLVITSTLDLRMQTAAQEIVSKKVKELGPKHDLTNGALVAMLPFSGEVLVMVGSANFGDDKIAGQVNVARSLRQPGSSIKPVLYATALHDNLISPATVLWDLPVTYQIVGSAPYRPVNYDGKFHGPVTVRTALANSYNVPAVKLLNAVTVDRMIQGAELMGIRSLSQSGRQYGLALTLGGGDVTLLELTTAYSTLASGGVAVQPEPILSATDAYGRPVLKVRLQSGDPLQAIAPSAAFQVTDILSDNDARTPMFGANSALKISKPAAAKTGTTDDWRDNWTVGYTRYLVSGAWTGNSDGRPMKRITGVAGAAPVWHEFMEAVLQDPAFLRTIGAPAADAGDAAWQFRPPPDVVLRPDCPTGMKCKPNGEYFSKAWLELAGTAGPLADTAPYLRSAPVFAAESTNRWIGYCQAEQGLYRSAIKLPGSFGIPGPGRGGQVADAGGPAQRPGVATRADVLQAINWSMRARTAVDFGPCDRLASVVPQGYQVSVDYNLAWDPKVGPAPGLTEEQVAQALQRQVSAPVETPAVEPTSEAEPVETPEAPAPDGPVAFSLAQPITHNNECPGNYIYGLVMTRENAPQPGIHVLLVDEWGNRADAISKSGETDAGRYDFPINNFANRYGLTLVDDAGNAISETVFIEHLQGAGGDSPCHVVVWRGIH